MCIPANEVVTGAEESIIDFCSCASLPDFFLVISFQGCANMEQRTLSSHLQHFLTFSSISSKTESLSLLSGLRQWNWGACYHQLHSSLLSCHCPSDEVNEDQSEKQTIWSQRSSLSHVNFWLKKFDPQSKSESCWS